MKAIIFTLFSLLISIPTFSQKYDQHWVFGQETYAPIPIFGGTDIIFGNDSVSAQMITRDIDFLYTNASICDKNGNLMFATNGIKIIGNDQQVIENGEGINPGEIHDWFVDDGYTCAQGAIILPDASQDSLFYILHLRATTSPMAICDLILKTTVDMRLNEGKGSVVAKNEIVLEHNFAYGKITATKHGNGRDWWVFQPDKSTNGYHKILLANDSITDIQFQEIGPIYDVDDTRGQAVFSPDGTKYARYDLVNDLNIFDFDRCNGRLTNPVHVPITDASDTTLVAGGLAFAPNSRFLYVSSYDQVYQFDTEAADIGASKIVVAVYDGFLSPYSTTFYMSQLAPNGKIYISALNQVNMLHVINQPDSLGLACYLQQHGLITPTYIVYGLPHFPNYRLGALEGSPCDSLVSEANEQMYNQSDVWLYPNPASSFSNITLKGNPTMLYSFTIFDTAGKECHSVAKGMESNTMVDVSNLSNGLYLLRFQFADGTIFFKKLSVVK
jgi:Secretion system C-terminal sorting domain